jgi:ATP-binding cassette subfamily C (CFTR/MRP) protein 1
MFEASINASRKLFKKFLLNLLRLSLSFFEQTPFGQIINRCSNDFDMIDNDIMFTLRSTLNAILAFIICFLLIAHVLPETIPLLILIFLPLIFLEVNENSPFDYLVLLFMRFNYFVALFLHFTFFSGFAAFAMQLVIYLAGYAASRKLHTLLLSGVLRVPMAFFDTTPIGRIINRFAKDMESIDSALPSSFSSSFGVLTSILITVIILIYGSWFAIFALIPLAIFFAFIQVFTKRII